MSEDIRFFESDDFSIGNCDYKASIVYTLDEDGEGSSQARVKECNIELTGEFNGNLWVKVDKEYFRQIEVKLQEMLELEWAIDKQHDH